MKTYLCNEEANGSLKNSSIESYDHADASENSSRTEDVAMLVSGGVDSSVAMKLLIDQVLQFSL
jgi:hypothetical protein